MSERPLGSRQYVEEAWSPFEVNVDGEMASCNFNANPERGGEATLCVIPTQALAVVEDPARMKEKPNVMSEWLDRLTAAGAGILLAHGRWCDDLWATAAMAARGVDVFERMEKRLAAVVSDALARGFARPGRVAMMGSSRHGFAVIHALASNPDVSACVAHQPVVHWPRMDEFRGMDGNPVVMEHSLYELTDRFAPKPFMAQTGYDDQRVGQSWIQAFTERVSAHYERAGAGGRFTHELLTIPGHDGARVPDKALDSVVDWLREQGLL